MFRNYSKNDISKKFSFEIHDVDISIVNGIRRILLTDIPNVGLLGEDDITIEIYKNNGPLHNEYLIHRIGLIPICLDENEIDNYEDNSLIVELNVENKSDKIINITTADFKGFFNDKELTKKDIERIFPVNEISKDHILITRIRPTEYLHFKGKAIKKTARLNASFSPVSLSNMFYIQDPSVAKNKESVLDKERSYFKNKYGDANALMFELEPINPYLSPQYLINKSLDIIIDKLNNIILNTNTEEAIKIEKFPNTNNTYDFYINNEDDTIGNIIQSLMHNKYIREQKSYLDGINCSYIGYICPHPLKTELIIRITLEGNDNINKEIFIRFLENCCRNIIDEINIIKKNWNDFIPKNKK